MWGCTCVTNLQRYHKFASVYKGVLEVCRCVFIGILCTPSFGPGDHGRGKEEEGEGPLCGHPFSCAGQHTPPQSRPSSAASYRSQSAMSMLFDIEGRLVCPRVCVHVFVCACTRVRCVYVHVCMSVCVHDKAMQRTITCISYGKDQFPLPSLRHVGWYVQLCSKGSMLKNIKMLFSLYFVSCSRSPSLDGEAKRVCEHVTVMEVDSVIQNLRYANGEGRWERGGASGWSLGLMEWCALSGKLYKRSAKYESKRFGFCRYAFQNL